MQTLLALSVICSIVLLVGWLYSELAMFLKRRYAASIDEVVEDTLSPPSHRP